MVFNCPNCGSHKFRVEDGAIMCECCNREADFMPDGKRDVEQSSIIKQIKDSYYEKITQLNEEKAIANAYLLHYKKLANPRMFIVIFWITLTISAVLLLISAGIYESKLQSTVAIISASVASISAAGLVIAKIINKQKRKKYRTHIEFYAAKVVECESEIETYTKRISKLIK